MAITISTKSVDYRYLVYIFAVLFLLTLTSVNINSLTKPKTPEILGASINNQKSIAFWEEFLAENPNYYDGWIELSKITYERGNYLESLQYTQKAREINPNSEVSKSLN